MATWAPGAPRPRYDDPWDQARDEQELADTARGGDTIVLSTSGPAVSVLS